MGGYRSQLDDNNDGKEIDYIGIAVVVVLFFVSPVILFLYLMFKFYKRLLLESNKPKTVIFISILLFIIAILFITTQFTQQALSSISGILRYL